MRGLVCRGCTVYNVKFDDRLMAMLWMYYGYIMAILSLCYGYVMAMLLLCNGYVMVM
jgi:hypothetical protein